MHISEIRNMRAFEEIDYVCLKSILQAYAEPRNKIQNLLKNEDLIRVKKGLYVFGKRASREPYCIEHLANLIYGPSAISLEYALSYYGLIPERVEEVTSITPRKNKVFETPVGRFRYKYLSLKEYAIGITQDTIEGRTILIATQEKALCDVLKFYPYKFINLGSFEEHLSENLRLDMENLKEFKVDLVQILASHYRNSNVTCLLKYLQSI